METYLDRMNSFTLEDLPDLDEVVMAALALFAETPPPKLQLEQFKRPLVVGSGNAAITGRILYSDSDAVFADESTFESKLATASVDGVVLISASGSKHAVQIAEKAKAHGLKTVLLTNNENAPARSVVSDDYVYVFPKNREPYTYNTSTYLGMVLAKTGERPAEIAHFIESEIAQRIPNNLASQSAFFLMVPEQFDVIRSMFTTKFDELFSSQLMGRVFTYEQTKHAKTVVPNETELFINFGLHNTVFGSEAERVDIPLPENVGPAAMIAIGYYCIGQIQKQFPPYFKESIVRYTEEASRLFGQTITPIVE